MPFLLIIFPLLLNSFSHARPNPYDGIVFLCGPENLVVESSPGPNWTLVTKDGRRIAFPEDEILREGHYYYGREVDDYALEVMEFSEESSVSAVGIDLEKAL